MTTTACTQPGCTGSHPRRLLRRLRVPRRRSARSAPPPPWPAAPSAPGRVLRQPGCTGTVVDGYCDVCGSPGRDGSPAAQRPTAARPRPSPRRRPAWPSRPRPCRAPPTGSPRPRSARRARRPAAARSPAASARPRPGCAAPASAPGLTSIPPVPAVDAAQGGPQEPDGARGPAHLPVCGSPVGPLPRRPARAHRGLLPELPQPVLVHAQAAGRRRGRRPVRGRRRHRPRRPRLDLRRPRPQRLRPLGRAQGPAELRRPRRPRRGHRRAAVPRPGRAPAHRRDLQLRDARGRRLHRHGVRRRHLAQAAAQGADAGGGRRLRPAARSTRRSPSSSRSCPPSSTCTTSTWSSATSSPTTSSRSGDAVKLIDLGGVRRARRPRLRDLRHDRLPGPGGAASSGPSVASDIYTIGRTLTVLAMEFRGYQSTYVASLPPVDQTPLFQAARLALPAAAQGVRPRPGRPLRLRRRAAGAAARGAARGRGASGARARPSTPRPPCSSTSPTVSDDSLDWQDLPALRTDDSDPQMPWLRTRQHRRPRRSGWPPWRPRPRSAPRCCWPGRAPRSRPGSSTGSTTPCGTLLADDPWEWRAVWMSGLVALARGRTAEAQSAFNAVYGQVPGRAGAQAGPGVRLRDRRRDRRGRVALRRLRPHRRQLHRPGRLRPGPDPLGPRATSTGAVRALDLVPVTSRAFTQARRRRAGLLAESGGGLPSLAAALDEHRQPDHRPGRPVPLPRRGAQLGAAARASRTAPTPRSPSAGRPAAEPALRDGLEAAYRDLAGYAPSREERVAPRRPGQRGAPLDAAMTATTGDGRGRARERRCTCPACSAPVGERRAVLRGLRCRPRLRPSGGRARG